MFVLHHDLLGGTPTQAQRPTRWQALSRCAGETSEHAATAVDCWCHMAGGRQPLSGRSNDLHEVCLRLPTLRCVTSKPLQWLSIRRDQSWRRA